MRVLYEAHQNIEGSLDIVTITNAVKRDYEIGDRADEYDTEACSKDLWVLKDWGNVEIDRESMRTKSLAEFLNVKYRYRISDIGVKVERSMIEIERAASETILLHKDDITKFIEALRDASRINDLDAYDHTNGLEIIRWWQELSGLFQKISERAADASALYEEKVNEYIDDKVSFLIYIERVRELIATYVHVLTTSKYDALEAVKSMEPLFDDLCIKIAEANKEHNVNAFNNEAVVENIMNDAMYQMRAMRRWFDNSKTYGIERVRSTGSALIAKLGRYLAISTNIFEGTYNRKEELSHIAALFSKAENINEAHNMFAYIFGATQLRHLKVNVNYSNSSFGSVFDEKPQVYQIEKRNREVSKKKEQSVDLSTTYQEIVEEEMMRHYEKIKNQFLSHADENGIIDNAKVNRMEMDVLSEFLKIVNTASHDGKPTMSEFGFMTKVLSVDDSTRHVIETENGYLNMPHVIMEVSGI